MNKLTIIIGTLLFSSIYVSGQNLLLNGHTYNAKNCSPLDSIHDVGIDKAADVEYIEIYLAEEMTGAGSKKLNSMDNLLVFDLASWLSSEYNTGSSKSSTSINADGQSDTKWKAKPGDRITFQFYKKGGGSYDFTIFTCTN